MAATPTQERPIGFGRLKRKEDARFIRGKGNYLDDIRLPGMLHGAVLRSPFAHARINSIDLSEAKEVPGFVAVFSAADVPANTPRFGPQFNDRPVIASGEVKYHGEPVAIVAAETNRRPPFARCKRNSRENSCAPTPAPKRIAPLGGLPNQIPLTRRRSPPTARIIPHTVHDSGPSAFIAR